MIWGMGDVIIKKMKKCWWGQYLNPKHYVFKKEKEKKKRKKFDRAGFRTHDLRV